MNLKDINISLPIEHERKNIDEAITKLSNLIMFYPFNPLKEKDSGKFWLKHGNMPFCGTIGECHKKGFKLIDDWLEKSDQELTLRIDIPLARKSVQEHLIKLMETVGYTKKKDRIIINNSFKELNTWIGEMYYKLSLQDGNGGWSTALAEESRQREERYRKREKNQMFYFFNEIAGEFRKVFKFNIIPPTESFLEYILKSSELDDFFNEIFQLMGEDQISCDGGMLKLLGNSVEELEERRVYKELDKYPKILENLNKAYEHYLIAEWNDVSLYCCKSLELFYKKLLGNKRENERKTLKPLIDEIIANQEKLFKKTDSAVFLGIKNLLRSGENIIGTIRNSRDSGHGNERDVLGWEAKMGYSYTILVLRTLLQIIK